MRIVRTEWTEPRWANNAYRPRLDVIVERDDGREIRMSVYRWCAHVCQRFEITT